MKQLISYLVTVMLWIAAIILCVTDTLWWLLPVLAALHLLELITVGFRIGRKRGCTIGTCIIMCMLFGFLWWLPLNRAYDKIVSQQ